MRLKRKNKRVYRRGATKNGAGFRYGRNPEEERIIDQRLLILSEWVLDGYTPTDIWNAISNDPNPPPQLRGIAKNTIFRDVRRIYDNWARDNAEAVSRRVNVNLKRIDKIFQVLFRRVLAGDLKASKELREWMTRESRYLGLDALDRKRMDLLNKISENSRPLMERLLYLLDERKIPLDRLLKIFVAEVQGGAFDAYIDQPKQLGAGDEVDTIEAEIMEELGIFAS